jgi:hypothetical protein
MMPLKIDLAMVRHGVIDPLVEGAQAALAIGTERTERVPDGRYIGDLVGERLVAIEQATERFILGEDDLLAFLLAFTDAWYDYSAALEGVVEG